MVHDCQEAKDRGGRRDAKEETTRFGGKATLSDGNHYPQYSIVARPMVFLAEVMIQRRRVRSDDQGECIHAEFWVWSITE